jgi:hypothetical protein
MGGYGIAIVHASSINEPESILTLGEVESRVGACENVEEGIKRAKVTHIKLLTKSRGDFLKKSIGGSGKNNIVDIQNKVGDVGGGMKNKQKGFPFCRDKTVGSNKSGEASKPDTRGLFRPIERFAEKTNMFSRRSIFKTFGLLEVDNLKEKTMEGGVLNI